MHRDRITKNYSAQKNIQVSGQMSIRGIVVEDIDEAEVKEALMEMKGAISALAVSGYASVRNPAHELRIKEIAGEILGVPVVCGHELTSVLGYDERTVTAVLNASLMPEIADLVKEIKRILVEMHIQTKVMIVKGDGSLMSSDFAEMRPIDTVMSGPAASVIGAATMTDNQNAIVVDIGGTTTDIAGIHSGSVSVKEEGAIVGGWQTRARAVYMQTHGLGGDSYLQLAGDYGIRFGPKRVMPICAAAERYPYLSEELENVLGEPSFPDYELYPYDCYCLMKQPCSADLGPVDELILNELSAGAHTAYYLGDKVGKHPRHIRFKRLVQDGYIQKISLTPTDLLHATGEYIRWDAGASRKAIEVAAASAEEIRLTSEKFIVKAKELFVRQLAFCMAKSVITFDDGQNDNVDLFLRKAIYEEPDSRLKLDLTCSVPVIGLGAPAAAWLPKACQILHSELILAENYEVANALGAAAAEIRIMMEVLIRFYPTEHNFMVYYRGGCKSFFDLKDALGFARATARTSCEKIAHKEKLEEYDISMEEESSWIGNDHEMDTNLTEYKIMATLIGKTNCIKIED